MKALLAGGPADIARELTTKLKAEAGIDVVAHWDYERAHDFQRPMPSGLGVVLLLKDMISHSNAALVEAKAKTATVRCVRISRKWARTSQTLAFMGLMGGRPARAGDGGDARRERRVAMAKLSSDGVVVGYGRAARIVGVSRQAVEKRRREGGLAARRLPEGWAFDRNDLLRWKEVRRFGDRDTGHPTRPRAGEASALFDLVLMDLSLSVLVRLVQRRMQHEGLAAVLVSAKDFTVEHAVATSDTATPVSRPEGAESANPAKGSSARK